MVSQAYLVPAMVEKIKHKSYKIQMPEIPFPAWFKDVVTEKLIVEPKDIDIECQANMWSVSLSPEQAKIVSIENVKDFILQVKLAYIDQLCAQGYPEGSMCFYCWHDEQAGRLRFSLVSASHKYLPFPCKLRGVEDIEAIVGDWLICCNLHGTDWEEEDAPYVLPIWSVQI